MMCVRVCLVCVCAWCVCVCVFIELRITAQSGPVILVVVCVCVLYMFFVYECVFYLELYIATQSGAAIPGISSIYAATVSILYLDLRKPLMRCDKGYMLSLQFSCQPSVSCVYVCIYSITHNRAFRPRHPSHSMPLALILAQGGINDTYYETL